MSIEIYVVIDTDLPSQRSNSAISSYNDDDGTWQIVGAFNLNTVRSIQRAELEHAIIAAKIAPQSGAIIYLESDYVLEGVNKWLAGWANNGWVTKKGSAVKNRDLWEEILKLSSKNIRWERWHSPDGTRMEEWLAGKMAISNADDSDAPVAMPAYKEPKVIPMNYGGW